MEGSSEVSSSTLAKHYFAEGKALDYQCRPVVRVCYQLLRTVPCCQGCCVLKREITNGNEETAGTCAVDGTL